MNSGVVLGGEDQSQSRLLRTLAEELKLPLMQIARSAELAQVTGNTWEIDRTAVLADTALRLLDSYVLSTQAMLGQQKLELEPVSLSATMYDTAQYLHKIAKLYDCQINLSIKGKKGLVMAHRQALQAALTSLGYSFISSVDSQPKKTNIILIAQGSRQGVLAGIQTTNLDLSSQLLQQAKDLYGFARQPLADMTHASGAGVLVARSLFDAMTYQLKVTHTRGKAGLAAILLPSQQLALL